MDQYPTLKLIAEKGDLIAIVIGLLPVLGALAIGATVVWHWLILATGLVAGGVLYGLTRSYVELVRVIADVMIPR
ncbi:MAG: hypothetical protein H7125_02955 [Proteobacteria bacterium]|nr:hypothetical protein [Burkholderiales bacterium]